MKCKKCEKEISERSKTGYCRKCYPSTEEAKRKNSEALRRSRQLNPEKFVWKDNGKRYGVASKEWRENHPEVHSKAAKSLSENNKNGKIIHRNKGKHLSIETREKISQKASCRNGRMQTKYYEVFCPYVKKNVRVQGTWEFKYCIYLNEKKIDWIRSRKINLRFKYSEDDILRTYYPDFYLPNSNEFIEIKGYYPEQNILKMKRVTEYNQNKKIIILFEQDLLDLGIDI